MGVGLTGIRISTRFFVALAVLLGSLAAVAGFGLHGLQNVQRANDQVFSDNFLTVEATARLATDLANAERIGLEIASANHVSEADQLRAQLDQTVVPQVNEDVRNFLQLHAGDPPAEHAQIQRIASEWKAVGLTAHGALASVNESASAGRRVQASDAIADAMDPLIFSVSARQPIERRAAAAAHAGAQATYDRDRTSLVLAAAAALAAAVVMLLVGVALKRMVDQRIVDQRFEESGSEYIETLQVTESEHEAQELLRRQVERSFDGTRAAVLVRNNSANRLEAKTSLAELDALRKPLDGATPRSCLAVRFARGHAEGDVDDPLVSCQICGALPGSSTCEPLLVGGEVIGVVLISHDHKLDEGSRQRVREMVGQAAPVLANLRNLAIAQLQAATDTLTGLPNRRAVEDTLKRMVAGAARTVSPLAALLVDLDHFKNINDVYGHERGDEVLAAAGVALRGVSRESDFVGRYGGEEFLLLLPSTDKQGALHVAEAARSAIAAIRAPGADHISASIGVAILPDDAGDAGTLFRSADRALYSAKSKGRDRVETIGSVEHDDVLVATAVELSKQS